MIDLVQDVLRSETNDSVIGKDIGGKRENGGDMMDIIYFAGMTQLDE